MWSILALGAAEALLNRIIDLDAISRLKLNALQGQMLRVVMDSPRLSVDVYFDENKLRLEATALGQSSPPSIFEPRPDEKPSYVQAATATLHVSDLVALFKLLSSADDELGNIPLQGDYHLLFALKTIMAHAELDLAAHLSPWLGATLAHEIGKIQQLPKQFLHTAKSAEFMLIDGLKEDSGLFAARWQMDTLQQQTRQLQQDIERAEAKTKQLLQKFTTPHAQQ
ncbi:MAG: hypothetical protein E6Q25_09840 [Acinetobacter sp.]|jgi:ubiquinone biosynthesis protein UbiJ|nr:MAG: hypothetical protein E6Q25_09840 [Acinetobacter sp.]